MTKRLLAVLVVLGLFAAVAPAFALDGKILEDNMWKISTIDAWFEAFGHPGFPHGPGYYQQVSQKIQERGAAQAAVEKEIRSITTDAERDEVRQLVKKFKDFGGFEKQVGYFVEKLLGDTARFDTLHEITR
jgi:hypothetical protein